MEFYDEVKPLYLDTDVSSEGPRPCLLQTREGMSCHRDEASDNSILRAITFTSKRLSSAQKKIQ